MEYKIRTYREGDGISLAKLFNRVYKKYAGFVPRTVDYWVWCCYERPDVENEGIIIAEACMHASKNIVGYAVLGKSGNVWELCVDPKANKKQIALIIFKEINRYFRRVHADRIVVNVPNDDHVMQEVCVKMGLVEQTRGHMFVGIVDFEALIEVLRQKICENLRSFGETFTVKLLNARPWINSSFSIKIEKGELRVSPHLTSGETTIMVDSDVFSSIVLGETTPLVAFLKGKLKIRPLRKISRALKFLGAIQVDSLWFYPLADFG